VTRSIGGSTVRLAEHTEQSPRFWAAATPAMAAIAVKDFMLMLGWKRVK
jgi:hypothetical protein